MKFNSNIVAVLLVAAFTFSNVAAQTPGRYALNLTDVIDNNMELVRELIIQKNLDPLKFDKLDIPNVPLTTIRLKNLSIKNLGTIKRSGNVTVTFEGPNVKLTVPLACDTLVASSFFEASTFFKSTSGDVGLTIKKIDIVLSVTFNVPKFALTSDVDFNMAAVQPDFSLLSGFWQKMLAGVASIAFRLPVASSIESFLQKTIDDQLINPINVKLNDQTDKIFNNMISTAMLYVRNKLIES